MDQRQGRPCFWGVLPRFVDEMKGQGDQSHPVLEALGILTLDISFANILLARQVLAQSSTGRPVDMRFCGTSR